MNRGNHPSRLRRYLLPLVGVALLAGTTIGVWVWSNSGPVAYPQGQCPPRAQQGTWEWPGDIGPRLHDRDGDKTIDDCVTVTGTILYEHQELDGDTHIRLLLDPQYDGLLVDGNRFQAVGQYNNLLVVEDPPQACPPKEIVVLGVKVPNPYAKNCGDAGGFIVPKLPPVGERVEITGQAVIDDDVAHIAIYRDPAARAWAEIHPASAITDLGPSNIQTDAGVSGIDTFGD